MICEIIVCKLTPADPNAQNPTQPPAYQTESPEGQYPPPSQYPPPDQYPPPGQYPPPDQKYPPTAQYPSQGQYPPPGQQYPPTVHYDQQQAVSYKMAISVLMGTLYVTECSFQCYMYSMNNRV